MGGTHPCIFTALDDRSVLFARKDVRFAWLFALIEAIYFFVHFRAVLSASERRAGACDGKYASRATAVPEFQ
jgi:hypothetical protein